MIKLGVDRSFQPSLQLSSWNHFFLLRGGRRCPWLALEVFNLSSHTLQRLFHCSHLLLETLHRFGVKVPKLFKHTELLVNFSYLISSLISIFFLVSLLEFVGLLLRLFTMLLEFNLLPIISLSKILLLLIVSLSIFWFIFSSSSDVDVHGRRRRHEVDVTPCLN